MKTRFLRSCCCHAFPDLRIANLRMTEIFSCSLQYVFCTFTVSKNSSLISLLNRMFLFKKIKFFICFFSGKLQTLFQVTFWYGWLHASYNSSVSFRMSHVPEGLERIQSNGKHSIQKKISRTDARRFDCSAVQVVRLCTSFRVTRIWVALSSKMFPEGIFSIAIWPELIDVLQNRLRSLLTNNCSHCSF